MQLAHLWLTDFRGHEASEVEVGPGITVFAGGNAQGKTTVLEAVGWLARMSSFRGAPDSALVRVGRTQAIVRAEIVPANREPDVRPDLIEAEIAAAGRNRVLLNRKPLPRARDLLGTLRVTVFAPDDLRLVKAGPAERRAELDDLLVALSPRYDAVEADYDRVLKHRNAWLRTWSRADDPATLDVWDEQLVRAGAELVRGRLKLLERLAAPLGKAYGDVAGSAADVAGAYEAGWAGPAAEGPPGGSPAVIDETRLDDVAGLLAAALARSRAADMDRRLTLVGPHRDDWRLCIDGLDARRYASQGEQRSLALAVRLAGHMVISEVVGEPPVLLLDDVFSELDENRGANLVAHLPIAQALVTTAGTLPPGLPADRVVWVARGRLGPGNRP
ncbi:MAG TPA: DNA replication/repair protein RecF [Acidimicrobiia bacterium]|nr:DNA replication/repair protein RecF [Acidimicrobiia bacterium]